MESNATSMDHQHIIRVFLDGFKDVLYVGDAGIDKQLQSFTGVVCVGSSDILPGTSGIGLIGIFSMEATDPMDFN